MISCISNVAKLTSFRHAFLHQNEKWNKARKRKDIHMPFPSQIDNYS